MTQNPKNQLLELLKDIGCSENAALFSTKQDFPGAPHHSKLVVSFPDGRKIQGSGSGRKVVDAEFYAASEVIQTIQQEHRDLIFDWDTKFVEAQRGDALIKLSVYLSSTSKTAHDKSNHLLEVEPDKHLARIYDKWKKSGDPGLKIFGPNLSEKKKATMVEALIWERFRKDFIADEAATHSQPLLDLLELG